jgi:ribose 5-phosphate isomerase RpiB
MKIAIGNDHAAVELKKTIMEHGARGDQLRHRFK